MTDRLGNGGAGSGADAGPGGAGNSAAGPGAGGAGATPKGRGAGPTPGRPIYLARAGYRSRRLMDAARFLPVAGMFLLIVPMLWQDPDSGIPLTARQAEYLFAVWAALVLVAAVLSRKLSRIMRDADTPEG